MTTRCGIDRIREFDGVLSGKRLGLVTGGSGVGRNYRTSIEILKEQYDLTALLSPEHGIRGEKQGGVDIKGYVDAGDLTKDEADKMCKLLDKYSKYR